MKSFIKVFFVGVGIMGAAINVKTMETTLLIKKIDRDFVSITLPKGQKSAVYKDEKRTAELLTRMLTKPSEVLKENLDAWEKYDQRIEQFRKKTSESTTAQELAEQTKDLAAHYPWGASFIECSGAPTGSSGCWLDRLENPLRNELGEQFKKHTKALLDSKKSDTIVYTSFGSGRSIPFTDIYNLSWIASHYPGKKIHINLIDPELKNYIAEAVKNKTGKLEFLDPTPENNRSSYELLDALEWLSALGAHVTINLFENTQNYASACKQDKNLQSTIIVSTDVIMFSEPPDTQNRIFNDFIELLRCNLPDTLIYTIIDNFINELAPKTTLTVMNNKMMARVPIPDLLELALKGEIPASDYDTMGILHSSSFEVKKQPQEEMGKDTQETAAPSTQEKAVK